MGLPISACQFTTLDHWL